MKICPQCKNEYAAIDWTCPICSFEPTRTAGFPELEPSLSEGGAGFPPEAFSELATLEAGNFWFRARNALILWVILRHFPLMERYFEIGCGTGYVLAGVSQAYPQASVTGSEIFSAGLSFAANRVKRAELIQMDARNIPYVNEFDVVGAFDVLEHIEEDTTVLTEMLKAIRSGGGLVVTVPQHPWLWSRQDEYARHVRRYRVGELRNKILEAGFKIEFQTSFVSLLLPVMLVSRISQRRPVENGDPLVELRLPPVLNWAFRSIMRLEHLLIRIGVRFPIGGSLLLVAKK